MYAWDFEHWPIVVVRQHGVHSDAEFQGYLKNLERLIRTGGPYAMLDDVTDTTMIPDLGRLRAFAKWYGEHRAAGEAACLISISVIPNAAIRGASKFFLKLATVTADVRVTQTVDEAFDLARGAFVKRGLKLDGVPLPATLIGVR